MVDELETLSPGPGSPDGASAAALILREAGLWVLDKPSGMAVHPTGRDGDVDLITWARRHLEAPAELAPIHRIDRDTSGLVLCAAEPEVLGGIGAWLAEGRIEKEYRALVHGHTHRKGVVRRALRDGRRGRGLEAVTRYWLLDAFGRASHLRVRPETGRKHQIRRHLQSLGHAVVGDRRYPQRRGPRSLPGAPARLWLHCHSLRLPDGRRFESPVPEALAAHLERLAADG